MLSMHKLTVGDGYAYLTRHVAAGDAGLAAGDSLTAYYEQTGNPPGRWIGGGLNALGDGRLAPARPCPRRRWRRCSATGATRSPSSRWARPTSRSCPARAGTPSPGTT